MVVSAETIIEKDIQMLSQLLADQNAVLVKKSVSVKKSVEKDIIVATFSLEGFYGGNNFQQYIAVYKPEFKTSDQPPFEKVGEAKYRLVGVRQLCPSPTVSFIQNSLEVKGNEITGVCEAYKNQNGLEVKFSLKVGLYDLTTKG